jgi:hypothetical protein
MQGQSPPRPGKTYVSGADSDNDVLFQVERKRFESVLIAAVSIFHRTAC